MTNRNISFIADEIASQLIFPDFEHRILDHRFNASVVHTNHFDTRVWLGHGKKFLKKESGMRIWWPWFLEVWEKNIANVRSWSPASDLLLAEQMQKHGISPVQAS